MKLLQLYLLAFVIMPCSIATARPDSTTNWRLIHLDDDEGFTQCSYASRDTLYAGGKFWSIDGGVTWDSMRIPSFLPGTSKFYDGRRGFYLGVGDSVWYTTDAGEHWSYRPSPRGLNRNADLVDSTRLYLLFGSWIGRTTDAGLSWSISELYSPDLHDVSFCNSQYGTAVGTYNPDDKEGGCFRTEDGGETWTTVHTRYPGALYSVCTVDKYTIFAAGEKGMIVTKDEGKTWRTVSSEDGIERIKFVTKAHGLAVGAHGLILVTIDSGKTWHRQSSPTGEYLYGLSFLNDSTAMVAGGYGVVLLTTDGGFSWVATDESEIPLHLRAFPNPSAHSSTLRYSLSSADKLQLTWHDQLGRKVLIQECEPQSAGEHDITVSTADLPSGVYRVTAEGHTSFASITMSHIK